MSLKKLLLLRGKPARLSFDTGQAGAYKLRWCVITEALLGKRGRSVFQFQKLTILLLDNLFYLIPYPINFPPRYPVYNYCFTQIFLAPKTPNWASLLKQKYFISSIYIIAL